MDIVLLIEEYLKDKQELRDIENDSLNICDGQIVRWDFTNIPQPTAEELAACEALVVVADLKKSKLAQIAELEAQLTPRRLREAVLSGDSSFISSIDSQIATIRATL